MRNRVSQRLSGRLLANGLVTAAAAALLAACSNSIERFQSASYDNPSDADPVYTASVPKSAPRYKKPRAVPAPVLDEEEISESPVARAPLAKPKYDYTESYQKAYKQPKLVASKPKYDTAPESSYEEPDLASAEPEAPVYRKPSAGYAKVTVGQGMTLYSIARTNDVDPMDLARYNRMKAPYHVWEGQVLRIPGVTTAELPEPTLKPRKQVAALDDETPDVPAAKSRSGNMHTVRGGETLYSLGRKYGISPFVIADANGLSHSQGLHLGQKVKIPGGASAPAVIASADDEEAPAPAPFKKKKAPLSLAEEETTTAEDTAGEPAVGEEPDQVADAETSDVKVKPAAQKQPQLSEAPASGALSLRWPLKGKVISAFGPKANGLKNEGINIAVPEGTSIRAAESGVVAYAGNELKGYGNLVLIRHAGGYVTAYAHAKDLLVKRGETVKRGDVIAKAGQTGAVSSPQLHFEVRKGATALDPMKHLSSATAMN